MTDPATIIVLPKLKVQTILAGVQGPAGKGGPPVFDVRDYGAKGDGTTDVMPPLVAAITDAMNAGGGIVSLAYDRLPNGSATPRPYRVASGGYTVDLHANFGNSVIIQGAGPAAPLVLDDQPALAGQTILTLNGPLPLVAMYDVGVRKKTDGLAGSGLCNAVFNFTGGHHVIVERFFSAGIVCDTAVLLFQNTFPFLRNVQTPACGGLLTSNSATLVLIHCLGGDINGTTEVDIGNFAGGFGYNGDSNTNIAIIGAGEYPIIGFGQRPFTIRHMQWDELSNRGILVVNDGALRIGSLRIEQCTGNAFVSTLNQYAPCFDITGVDDLRISSCVFGGRSQPCTQAIKLSSVKNATIERCTFNATNNGLPGGQMPNRITADSACGSVRVVDCSPFFLDLHAADVEIIRDGQDPIRVKQELTGNVVRADTEEPARAFVEGVAGANGTGTYTTLVVPDAVTHLDVEVKSYRGTDAFRAQAEGVYKPKPSAGGVPQSAFVPAITGSSNPKSNALGIGVADISFTDGAGNPDTVVLSAAGAGALGDRAIVTITNKNTLAGVTKDYALRARRRRTWAGFSPSRWIDLFGSGDILAWYDYTTMAADGSSWFDKSGNHFDLTAPSNPARPTVVTASNGLQAFQFDGTRQLTATGLTAIQFGTIITVGTFTGDSQCQVGLNDNNGGALDAGSIRLMTASGLDELVCQPTVAATMASASSVLTMRTCVFSASQGNIYSGSTQGNPQPFTLTPGTSNTCISIGKANDGTLGLGTVGTPAILQLVMILKQAIQPDMI